MLRVFVYGTLKRGMANHERYCRSLAGAEAAWLHGRLYQLPVGYPMLVVPPESVLARGTSDRLADEALLLEDHGALPPLGRPQSDWDRVEGELLLLDDTAATLPRLDELENYRAGVKSLYERVLVWCQVGSGPITCWTYIAPDGNLPAGAMRIGPSWPSR